MTAEHRPSFSPDITLGRWNGILSSMTRRWPLCAALTASSFRRGRHWAAPLAPSSLCRRSRPSPQRTAYPQLRFAARPVVHLLVLRGLPAPRKAHALPAVLLRLLRSRRTRHAVPQVVLKWSLQRGVAVVTGTDNKEHMASDLDLWSFKLSEADLGVISSLHTQQQAM